MSAPVRVSPEWLALREPADAAARSADLADEVARRLAGRPVVVHDLGAGTGSMARWLAPRLAGPQRWIMYDRDPDLLARHSAGPGVTVETRERDITRLDRADLAGASLITASALLDMFTAAELARFADSCVSAQCPVLVTISVVGRVELEPADPLDDFVVDAFNAHQRRTVGGRTLLGPDAAGTAVDAFTRLGADVLVRPSPWRLGADQARLAAEWFTGWWAAACEQRPELAAHGDYARRRQDAAAGGRLGVTVHHDDLLVLPR